MAELRKDPVVGRWVIISTERGKRPQEFLEETLESADTHSCPFCPGNENQTPPEIYALRPNDSLPDTPGWEIRVIPNKYPALRREGNINEISLGLYTQLNGVGAHEVIIETPDHNYDITNYSISKLINILEVYKSRLHNLRNDRNFKYIMLFKNKGLQAGASLSHPHTQLIATPVTPKRVKEKLAGALDYYNSHNRCVFCDIIKEERSFGKRIISENDHYISFCPFASRFPYEILILPKRHYSDFIDITYAEIHSLSEIMKSTFIKLKGVLNNPQYNFTITSAPIKWPQDGYWTTVEKDFHWHLEIIPRLTSIAGFEWGTGFYINPMIPEKAAQLLRAIS